MPEALRAAVVPGVIVRVPLRGRRVRGWVVSVAEATRDPEALAEVAGVSGRAPLFDEPVLAAARVLARRTVSPLAAVLHLMTPPRMGRAMGRRSDPGAARDAGPRPPGASPGTRTLRRLAPGEDPVALYAEAVSATLASGRGAVVVVPEVREGSRVLEGLQGVFGAEVAVVHSSQDPAARSAALWSVARGERRVVLGGRAAALVPAFSLGLIVVHAESDRTLKEQRSPYYDARDAAELRAAACGADLLLAAEGPTLRTWHRATADPGAWRVVEPSRPQVRAVWPLVELLEPARSIMPRRAVAAILAAVRAGSRVLVFVPRRAQTAAGPGPAEVAAYLRRMAPGTTVERADPSGLEGEAAAGGRPALEAALQGQIVVATDGALADVERPAVGTAVVLGVDALIHRPSGRAAEEAFGILWELAHLVARRPPGGRLLLETGSPGHHVVQAVVRGDYHFFARHELDARWESNAPPFSTLIRVRASSPPSGSRRESVAPGMADAVLDRLRGLPGTEVLGPVEGRLGAEVLLKVETVEEVLDPLRAVVASAAERLLVEVDPREW